MSATSPFLNQPIRSEAEVRAGNDPASEREWQAWRKRSAKAIPALANRVFALREVRYPGCGFHWAMEHSLGHLIASLNDYDRAFSLADRLVTEVLLEELHRDVARAEGSAP